MSQCQCIAPSTGRRCRNNVKKGSNSLFCHLHQKCTRIYSGAAATVKQPSPPKKQTSPPKIKQPSPPRVKQPSPPRVKQPSPPKKQASPPKLTDEMSTLRYPSKLQQRYAQTVFPVPNEQIISILAKVDDKTFDKLCEEPEFRPYCSGNSILAGRLYEERSYRKRSEAEFDIDILKFKPKDMKWKDFYLRITNFISNYKNEYYVYKIAKEGKLMELKILHSINKSEFDFNIPNYAALNYGNLEVLKWLTTVQPPILPNQRGANSVAENGHLEVLKWLASFQPPILPDQFGANSAAQNGHLEVLKWLASFQPPILPDQFGANRAAKNGHLEVLKWLASFQKPILPDEFGANYAAQKGHLEVLKWLASLQTPILPNEYGANLAASRRHLEVLKWLTNFRPPILPTEDGANQAALNGDLEVLRFLATQQPPILPDEDGANMAAYNGHLEVLKWLANLQPPILPNEEDMAAELEFSMNSSILYNE